MTQHKKLSITKAKAFVEIYVMVLFDGTWGWRVGVNWTDEYKKNRRGQAKHENIIKIIYFSAAIVVFPLHPLLKTWRVLVLDILISQYPTAAGFGSPV